MHLQLHRHILLTVLHIVTIHCQLLASLLLCHYSLPSECTCDCRDGRQTQLDINQQASERRLLASALAARTDRIKQTVESIVNKLDDPQPGSYFVESVAAGLDAGEIQITELKAEQRQKYDALTKEVSCIATVTSDAMLQKLGLPCWLCGMCIWIGLCHSCHYMVQHMSRLTNGWHCQ